MNHRVNRSTGTRFTCQTLTLVILAALTWHIASPGLAEDSSAVVQIDSDLCFLASDEMQGRGIGTTGLERSAEFIAERFEKLGLKTDVVDGGPFQVFKSSTRVPKVEQGVDWEAIHAAKAEATNRSLPRGASHDSEEKPAEKPERSERRSVNAKNVMALLPGEGPLADEVIVVGAHYDHLGYRAKNGKVTVFNGANDNASGTVGILEIARLLSEREKKLPRSVLFIAFSAEERGLVGSFFYVKHPVLPIEKTVAMVNLDMVGCMEGEQVMASGSGTSKLLTADGDPSGEGKQSQPDRDARQDRRQRPCAVLQPGGAGRALHHDGRVERLSQADGRRGNSGLRGNRPDFTDGRRRGRATGEIGGAS